jgi:hypothetical protein
MKAKIAAAAVLTTPSIVPLDLEHHKKVSLNAAGRALRLSEWFEFCGFGQDKSTGIPTGWKRILPAK